MGVFLPTVAASGVLCDCGFVVLLVLAWGLLRSFTVLVVLIYGFAVCGMFVRCSEVSFLCGFVGDLVLVFNCDFGV